MGIRAGSIALPARRCSWQSEKSKGDRRGEFAGPAMEGMAEFHDFRAKLFGEGTENEKLGWTNGQIRSTNPPVRSTNPCSLLMTGLLIDDDPLVVQTIGHFVEKSDLVEGCEHAGDAATAVNLLSGGRFSFVLLDLHLPDLPGQAVLEAVPPSVPVIVISSDPGFGAASYNYPHIVDYLVKPFDYVGFHRALGRVATFLGASPALPSRAPGAARTPQVIFVKSGTEIVRLVLDEIRYVKAEANYVSFHLGADTRPVMALTTLKHIARELPANFLQVQRSYLVNRDHVVRVEGQVAHVEAVSIPIGDSYRAGFLARLGIVA
jgi:DNA-binding LytR/AlgR family response regulator